jgi:hypothetical protein
MVEGKMTELSAINLGPRQNISPVIIGRGRHVSTSVYYDLTFQDNLET